MRRGVRGLAPSAHIGWATDEVTQMDLLQAMRTASTTRYFRPDPVPDEPHYRVLDAARFAPSGGNQQGWAVIVVKDPALRLALKELYLRTWRPFYQARMAQASAHAGNPAGPAGTANLRRGAAGDDYGEHMDELPVHLVVLVRTAALQTPFPAINASSFAAGSSIYPFVQNVLLALRAEGLGAALTMLLNNEEDAVRELLAIPGDFALVAHIGVGWPARPHPTRLNRRAVEEFARVDRFDGEPLRP
jgi:nitroreductase